MKHTIGIILAAGNSSRFMTNSNQNNIPKQLYLLNDKPIINYSIDSFLGIKNLEFILVVTNSKYYQQMITLKNQYYRNENEKGNEKGNIIYLINDIDCRIESINVALNYINNDLIINTENTQIIIHDSARPYVTTKDLNLLLEQKDVYSQYYMKLVNGLMNLESHEFLNRDNYIEICTPLCINLTVLNDLFVNYINKKDNNGNRIYYEFIPLLKKKGLKYKLVEGHYSFLRKITTYDDVRT